MAMTNSSFAAELTELYAGSYPKNTLDCWLDKYVEALSSIGAIDFRRLWHIFNTEYESTRVLPPVAWLVKAAKRARLKTEDSQPYVDVRIYNPVYKTIFTDCATSGMTKDEILKAYLRKFPNAKEDFEILEITPWR